MSWRTVIISTRCKLDLKMGYMVIRGEDIVFFQMKKERQSMRIFANFC